MSAKEDFSFLSEDSAKYVGATRNGAQRSPTKRLRLSLNTNDSPSDETLEPGSLQSPFSFFKPMPPPIRRSASLVYSSSSEDASFKSPQSKPFYFPSGGRSDRRSTLQRSLSLNELSARKSLDFNSDAFLPRMPSNGSNESLASSLSTETDLSKSDDQDSGFIWNKSMLPKDKQMLRKRRVSGSFDDKMCTLASSRASSPMPKRKILSDYCSDAAEVMTSDPEEAPVTSNILQDTFDEADVVMQMSTLGVSQRMPMLPPTKRYGQAPAFTLNTPQQLQQVPYETPTREQLQLRQLQGIDANEVVAECKLKVKLVVFDLDQTLINIHTKGNWTASGEVLGDRHLRPVFKVLLGLLLDAGIPVGIATFSPQEEIVRDMLEHVFKPEMRLDENVFIRGKRGDEPMCSTQETIESVCEGVDEEMGKRRHIQCILERLEKVPGQQPVAPREILFVDDDSDNALAAKKDGHRVVHYRDSWTDTLFLNKCLDVLRTE